MPNYALYDSDTILNVILADSKEVAESQSGMNAVECVEAYPWIGFTLINDHWVRPKPYPSWILNEDYDWDPPVPKPEDDIFAIWDEETQTWISGKDNN